MFCLATLQSHLRQLRTRQHPIPCHHHPGGRNRHPNRPQQPVQTGPTGPMPTGSGGQPSTSATAPMDMDS
eukprot:5086706-Amphidinium_carterae.1